MVDYNYTTLFRYNTTYIISLVVSSWIFRRYCNNTPFYHYYHHVVSPYHYHKSLPALIVLVISCFNNEIPWVRSTQVILTNHQSLVTPWVIPLADRSTTWRSFARGDFCGGGGALGGPIEIWWLYETWGYLMEIYWIEAIKKIRKHW